MNDEQIAAIRARWSAATPGPWKWRGNGSSWALRLEALIPMRPIVMAFARWGWSGAQPLFRDDARCVLIDPPYIRPKPYDRAHITGIDHPDAIAIEHAPADVAALLAEVDRLAPLAAATAVMFEAAKHGAVVQIEAPNGLSVTITGGNV